MKYLETIYYFTPRDIQVARVDRQCIIRFCNALSKLVKNVKVVTVVIKLNKYEQHFTDLYSLYGIDKRIEFIFLQSNIHQDDESALARLRVIFLYLIFAFKEFVLKGIPDTSAVYLKNYSYIFIMLLIKKLVRRQPLVLFEIHRMPQSALQKFLLRRVNGIIANSHRLAGDLNKLTLSNSVKVIGLHQGVDLEYIDRIRISKNQARNKLNLSQDKFLIVYTGKVYYGYKEIEYYIKLSELINETMQVIIVGGRSDQVRMFRDKCSNNDKIKFISFVKPTEVFYFQFAADVLLLYYPPGLDINEYRSPGKVFEYMASGNPIVVSDYPVLKEIVKHNESALFVEKDNPQALFNAVMQLKNDKTLRETLSRNAVQRVEQFTWEKRAECVMEFMNSLLN